jgi:hypothetical protein
MFSYQWYRGNLSKRTVCEQVVPYPVLGQVKRLSKLQSLDNIYSTTNESGRVSTPFYDGVRRCDFMWAAQVPLLLSISGTRHDIL